MSQLENIEAIEKRLWNAADTLRANSNYASNEYFMPVMGLIFLRHAHSRYLNVRDEIVASLPTRGGTTRPLTKEDFSQKGAIFLQERAQFDYLVELPEGNDLAKAIIDAMESIENDYESLRGVLPKEEYRRLNNDVLGYLLGTLNPEELQKASGDIFGRIYEYFLTQFANENAHDGGEFFTPVSLVSFIANVLEPERGIVLDPACGSGGMFVQSAHIVERSQADPTERLTFYGYEKNPTTIRLAKMNLAVHGLEGDIQQSITYYQEPPHKLLGKADYVMANPPFNVDEVDAGKIKNDPRLPLGVPGVNKDGKVPNGNYLWINYFYSYLNEKGRAGFVMSSQASSAGREEAKVRRQLIETAAVDIMVAVRSNFFYTRTVPCELWFLNRAKPEEYRDKVLMLDARSIYRKVTRKIYDFSPEQLQNLLSIVWLYRGENERFLNLVAHYLEQTHTEAEACFMKEDDGKQVEVLSNYNHALDELQESLNPFLATLPEDAVHAALLEELNTARHVFWADVEAFGRKLEEGRGVPKIQDFTISCLIEATAQLSQLADHSRDLVKQIDMLNKLAGRLIDVCENQLQAKEHGLWKSRDIMRSRKTAELNRQTAIDQLKKVHYFHKQAVWLTERFPDGVLRDIEGLVKLVDKTELEANDCSLSPGRYVGVAPEEEDDDFDFEEAMREIHSELDRLNAEASQIAEQIKKNFEGLGI